MSYNTKEPIEDITIEKVESTKQKINSLPDNINEKKNMLKQINELEKYTKLKEKIESCLEDNQLKENVTEKTLKLINNQNKSLINSHQSLLREKIEYLNSQYEIKIKIKEQIDNLYTDNSRSSIR